MSVLDGNGNSNGMVMPVAPMYGGGYGGGNGWGFGNDGGLFWLLVLFLFGFAGNGWGGFGGNGGGMMPYMMTNNIDGGVQRGFDQQAIMTGINGINNAVNTGFGNVQTALCSGFAGVNAGVSNGFAQAEIANNARQIANMQQDFAAQTAITQGMNNIGMSLQNCCCENRAGVADLKYTVATENCADRTQSLQNTRDIIDAVNRGNQGIIDKLCALELDGVKNQLAQSQRENVGLQNQLNMANLAASQAAQNTQIVDSIYNRLSTCPVGTVPVYGESPIFHCNNNNNGCGCGCGNGFAN